MQRPAFVRQTKHSGVGHEDIRYSYVVVRRGPRPSHAVTQVGRVGEIGRTTQANLDAKDSRFELLLHNESVPKDVECSVPSDVALPDEKQYELHEDMRDTLRQEAYQWPRVVFPPLKRSGHVILDVCSPEGASH
jgi:hypothetical protein